MGLFDSVRCDLALPDGCQEREFQTKSLGSLMRSLQIDAGGRLLRADGSDTGYHGVMRFYTRTPAGAWHEYQAQFTDGRLQHLLAAADARFDEDGFARPCAADTIHGP